MCAALPCFGKKKWFMNLGGQILVILGNVAGILKWILPKSTAWCDKWKPPVRGCRGWDCQDWPHKKALPTVREYLGGPRDRAPQRSQKSPWKQEAVVSTSKYRQPEVTRLPTSRTFLSLLPLLPDSHPQSEWRQQLVGRKRDVIERPPLSWEEKTVPQLYLVHSNTGLT